MCTIVIWPITLILLYVFQDIDLVITAGRSEHFDSEDIKEEIVDKDDRYFLEPSRQPNATYQVLYCRLPGWWTENRCVKIDILVPPALGIPRILSSNTVVIGGIPVMPLFDLLVMKIQGWQDHDNSRRPDFRAKVGVDVTDIRALLNRALSEHIWYPTEKGRHSDKFIDRARTLSFKFIKRHGGSEIFQKLGFPV
jgi:hypothetical protein